MVETPEKGPGAPLYVELAEKHGHYCPMSTLGLRIGWAARVRLGTSPAHARYLARTCAVDGIAHALELSELTVDERGQHLLRIETGRHVMEIGLRDQALLQAASYRHLETDAERELLLERLRRADEAELLEIRHLETGA